IDNDHALAGLNGIEMDFERVRTVFEVIAHARGLRGQLLRLAHWNEAGVQAISQRRPEDKAARLNAEDQVDVLLNVVRGQRVDQLRKTGLVLQQRGDVVEQDARLGKVRHGADQLLQRFTVQRLLHFL